MTIDINSLTSEVTFQPVEPEMKSRDNSSEDDDKHKGLSDLPWSAESMYTQARPAIRAMKRGK